MNKSPEKLRLTNRQSPGDILMLTAAVRDLHHCYPGRFLTEVRTSCHELWLHNPHLSRFEESDPEVLDLECHYPLVGASNRVPKHFQWGFVDDLSEKLGLHFEPQRYGGDIHLSPNERRWLPQMAEITGADLPYWIIVAGGKQDFTIKWWSTARWQAVVDHFRGRLLFAQVGATRHHHPALDGVVDLRGRTTLRQLVRLVHHAEGVVCPVTCLMHLAASVPVRAGRAKNRACVVVAGGREPSTWEAYPHHQFLHTCGALPCCEQGGCWKARTEPLGDGDEKDTPAWLCTDPVSDDYGPPTSSNGRTPLLPRCMAMITPERVVAAIETYLAGGACHTIQPGQWEEAIARAAARPAEPLAKVETKKPACGCAGAC